MPRLVGIGGLLGSGKDEVSDRLVDNYGWVKMGMSDPLNDALLTLNPIVSATTEGDPFDPDAPKALTVTTYQTLFDSVGYTVAKQTPEVRRLLQALGTEVGRDMIDQNVWVDIAAKRARAHMAEGKNVIITGIRFPNEVEMITREGGKLWWVDRPENPNTPVDGNAAHASENSVGEDDFDMTISNDGTLDELYFIIDALGEVLSEDA